MSPVTIILSEPPLSLYWGVDHRSTEYKFWIIICKLSDQQIINSHHAVNNESEEQL